MTARRRVALLLEAARDAFGPTRPTDLVAALATESGLHPENVRWALDHALELHPTDAELDALFTCAPCHSAVLVSLAANVFVAPLRALAWALAQSDRVFVRASQRAQTFPRALVARVPSLFAGALACSTDPSSDLGALVAQLPPGAALHAYGNETTLRAIGAQAARHGVSLEAHGPGFGAIVDEAAVLIEHARAIARDVVAFDQAGCLSPRIVIATGDADEAAEALHAALAEFGAEVPRRRLDPHEHAALARLRDAAIYAGFAREGASHLVARLPDPSLGPAARALVVTGARDEADAVARLRRLGPELACLATSSDAVAGAFPGARRAPLGRMQRPPLDGPVDRRGLEPRRPRTNDDVTT